MSLKRLVLLGIFISIFSVSFASEAIFERIGALREAADSLHSIGMTDSAAVVGREAILLAEKSGDPTQIVGTHAAQGVFLRSLGKVKEALESYETALEVVTSGKFRENPDQEAIEEIASLYINLAVLNLDTSNKEEAAANAVFSAEWIAKSKDPELRSTVYGVVGSVLTGCGKLDDAGRYQSLAYKDALTSGDDEAALRAAAYTMLVADRQGRKNEAQQWREKCKELLPKVDAIMAKLVYYQAECSISLKGNDSGGALHWFDEILDLDGIDNLPFVKYDCYNNMHIAYADLGDYENAYSTLMKSTEIRDSLWEQEKMESLQDLNVKYQTKEAELALSQSETRRMRTLAWLFAAVGLLLLGVVAFIIYWNRERRRRMEKEIEFANLREETNRELTRQYIEGLENERRRMSRELHDGVCNDLLAIQMNMKNGKPAEQTASLINNCRESVRRISHELMPPEFAYADLDEVVRFFVAKQGESNSGKIAMSYSSSSSGVDWASVPDTVSLEVYRIIQEAVGNAVKHSGATEITVSLTLADGVIEAVVSDNGHYSAPKGRGIGLESMKKRANSINGVITIDSMPESGTRVVLTCHPQIS